MGIVPANITGGTFVPVVNFSVAVPFCGIKTHGWEVIDNSSLPDIFYICERAFNGSYAWMPYCPCSAALINGTVYYFKTSIIMGQNATLLGDNTTQWINEGFTFVQNLYVSQNGTFALPRARQQGMPYIFDGQTYLYSEADSPYQNLLFTCVNDTCSYQLPIIGGTANEILATPSERGSFYVLSLPSTVTFPNNIIVPGTTTLRGATTLQAPLTTNSSITGTTLSLSGSIDSGDTVYGNTFLAHSGISMTIGAFGYAPIAFPSGVKGALYDTDFSATVKFYETATSPLLSLIGTTNTGGPANTCSTFSNGGGTFTLTFVRIGATKHVYFTETGGGAPYTVTFGAGNNCAYMQLFDPTSPSAFYTIPADYRPTQDTTWTGLAQNASPLQQLTQLTSLGLTFISPLVSGNFPSGTYGLVDLPLMMVYV